jgi:hypothetical protein
VTNIANPLSSLRPVALTVVFITAAVADPTELILVESIDKSVVNILVPPATLVGIDAPDATLLISMLTDPEVEGVYRFALTPSIRHCRGILK